MEVERGVYDLRIVARYVSGGDAAKLDVDEVADLPGLSRAKWRQFYLYPDASFSAAFSRAVRSLIRRGQLEVVHRFHRGKLSSQIRFVRLCSKSTRN
ncbi:hypothetical protein [Tunturiibacter gelidoferens]|uniref:hypothetical protein n=1 Tax=Tunturiibacter gelidiferens TaxID=3069689 RepID=UPI00161F0196|nr:hypothetical protein [Edaphobacter lichenicola]